MGEKRQGCHMVAVSSSEALETERKHSALLKFCSNRRVLGIFILLVLFGSKKIYDHMDDEQQMRRKEVLVGMCDQRARMLQDQFSVSVNHVHALAILVSTFHYYKNPSAIDQVCCIMAFYTFLILEFEKYCETVVRLAAPELWFCVGNMEFCF